MENLNVVAITGNLTRDPELRYIAAGNPVCDLRIAVNSRRKDAQTGEWSDKPNFLDVVVWGRQAEAAAEYLAKGRPVAVNGRLDWSEWEAKDGSGKRQRVQIVASMIQFLGVKPEDEEAEPEPVADRFPVDEPQAEGGEPEPVAAGVGAEPEEDISF
ncbi:MAG: single-stranded DNA-binding protein [Solirubrobacterales bacterium]